MAISVKDSGSGKRRKGTFNLPGNFEVKIEGPLDTRMVVGSITDLLDTVNIDGEPKYQYYGMLVVVSGDENSENDGLYKLIEGGDPTDIGGWEKLLSGNNNDLLPDTIFSAHTGDTSIHFTKEEISLSEIGDSAHTHTLSEITDFDNYSGSVKTQIDTKLDSSDFISHTGDTNNPHKTSFSNLTSTAHTHSISDITDLQSELNDKLDTTDFNAYKDTTKTTLNDKLDTSDFDAYTGSVKDVHVSSGTVNVETQSVSFENTTGGTFFVTNAAALFTDSDSYVTGGTYNANTGIVNYRNSTGGTFEVTGFNEGITDTFVSSGSLDGTTLKLTKSDGTLVNDIELSGINIWEENAAGDTATYDGNIVANSLSSQSTNTCRIINPEGATYYKSATATGAFIIRLPQGWTYSHINMKVKIYEYSSDEDITLNISGYNYKNDEHTNGGYWANTTAWIEGSPEDVDNHNLPVKFGYDKLLEQCIVIIGDDEYSGQFTSVYVTDVQVAGHVEDDERNDVKASDVSLWNSGWYIFRSNTWSTAKIEDTETNRFIFNSNTTVSNTQTNNWIRNTDDSIIYNKGTVNIGVRSISEDKLKLFVTRDDIGGINDGINDIPEIGISGSTHTALGYGSSTTNSYGIAMGTLQSSGRSWIQSKRFRWSGGEPDQTYDLLLNPLGGHVGIGTDKPSEALEVNGRTIIRSDWVPGAVPALSPDANKSVYSQFSVIRSDDSGNPSYGLITAPLNPGGFMLQNQYLSESGNYGALPLLLNPKGGNVGIGTDTPSEALEVAGNIIADSLSTEWSGNTRILSPGGGSFSAHGNQTGAFIITLPQGGKNTMLSMTVKIYDHSKNEHITLNLAGYATVIYSQYTSAWKYPSAWVEGNPKDEHNFTVRFTYDLEKDKNVIIIGEKTSTWSHPDINIVDVQVGYGNSTPDKWNDGWKVELSTDWDTIMYDDDGENKIRYVEPNQNNAVIENTQTNNWIRNTDDSIIYNKGTVNIGVRSISEDNLKLFATSDSSNIYKDIIPEIGISGSTHTALGYGSSINNSYGIAMGTLQSTGRSWIQSKRFRGSDGHPDDLYDLLLNPLGGHVGIGTTNADSALHIKGSDYNDSGIRLHNTANSNTDNYWIAGMRSFAKSSDGNDVDGFEIGRNAESAGGKFYITNDGNVSIGNGYQPKEKLEVAGNIIANSISTVWPHTEGGYQRGNTRILSPGGGSFSKDLVNSGAIIITLPQGKSSTMISMTVKIFDYDDNEHITLNIAGYVYFVNQTYTSGWLNPSAWVEGNPNDEHNFTVRFTYDHQKDKNVIIIGETDSEWSHPDINIIDVQVGFKNSESPEKWNDGWEIELSDDWDTLIHNGNRRYPDANASHGIVENTQAHNWIRNTDNSIKYESGDVNITNGTLTINNNYTLPAADGEADQVLKTDGDGVVTWQNDTDTDTSIWTEAGDTATYDGIAKSDVFAFYKTRHTRIISPQGAEFRTSDTEKGRIKITAPPVISSTSGSQGTQFKATIKVFSDSLNFDLHVSCYLQDYDDIHWYYAWIDSPPDGTNKYNFKVRFYYDENDKFAISIGEHTDSWRYSKVNVTEVILGHNNRDIDDWATGWNIKLDVNETITRAASPTATMRTISSTQSNNWGKSGTSLKYEAGDVNITNGTLSLKGYTFPASDGNDGEVLKTDGNGNVTWQNDIDTDTDTSIWSEKILNPPFITKNSTFSVYSAYYNAGNVGIGTNEPQNKLHIEGDDFNKSGIRFLNKANSNSDYWMIGSRSFSGNKDGFEIGRNFGATTGGDSTGGKLYIANSGDVSIGNGYEPTEKLEVKGNILADGGILKVANEGKTFSVGPLNTSWTHFNTNSINGFYFYRPIKIVENTSGEVFKSENNYITVSHNDSKLDIQNKSKRNHHPGLRIKDINGDVTFQAVTSVDNNTGVGAFSKVQSTKGKLEISSASNTIEIIPNSSEGDVAWGRRSTFESNGNLTLRGSIRIEGGSPGSGKVLTSDGSGNASWQTPSSSNGSSSSNQFAGVGTPVGSVIMWSTNSAPTGWFICDGSWIKKDDYLELYNVIGDTYSPNGLRNSNGYIEFQLPDLRSRIPVGYNSSDGNFNDIGKKGGASTHTLTENQIPHKKHRHSIGTNDDGNGNAVFDEASEHFHAISWVRDSSGEGDTLTNDQAKSVIDLFNSRKLNANGSDLNWKMKIGNTIVDVINDVGDAVSNPYYGINSWKVWKPLDGWDSSNANWVYTGIHKFGPDDNTNGVSNLEAIQNGDVAPDGAHGHSSEFMSTGQATSNAGGSAHNNLQPYFVMNYIICANAVEQTSSPATTYRPD